ncbi:hypothetical protein LTR62_005562 [Meristemomyces frigidus]|uniref:Uncharacterized protein n=1 Tax=Meristemomyces frigidus TaxID=1508187 RepID=A0AAN7TKU6_9PEZI|nr:hypothetical protein LTR62_005562 [Meristemomyces frigidus]
MAAQFAQKREHSPPVAEGSQKKRRLMWVLPQRNLFAPGLDFLATYQDSETSGVQKRVTEHHTTIECTASTPITLLAATSLHRQIAVPAEAGASIVNSGNSLITHTATEATPSPTLFTLPQEILDAIFDYAMAQTSKVKHVHPKQWESRERHQRHTIAGYTVRPYPGSMVQGLLVSKAYFASAAAAYIPANYRANKELQNKDVFFDKFSEDEIKQLAIYEQIVTHPSLLRFSAVPEPMSDVLPACRRTWVENVKAMEEAINKGLKLAALARSASDRKREDISSPTRNKCNGATVHSEDAVPKKSITNKVQKAQPPAKSCEPFRQERVHIQAQSNADAHREAEAEADANTGTDLVPALYTEFAAKPTIVTPTTSKHIEAHDDPRGQHNTNTKCGLPSLHVTGQIEHDICSLLEPILRVLVALTTFTSRGIPHEMERRYWLKRGLLIVGKHVSLLAEEAKFGSKADANAIWDYFALEYWPGSEKVPGYRLKDLFELIRGQHDARSSGDVAIKRVHRPHVSQARVASVSLAAGDNDRELEIVAHTEQDGHNEVSDGKEATASKKTTFALTKPVLISSKSELGVNASTQTTNHYIHAASQTMNHYANAAAQTTNRYANAATQTTPADARTERRMIEAFYSDTLRADKG